MSEQATKTPPRAPTSKPKRAGSGRRKAPDKAKSETRAAKNASGAAAEAMAFANLPVAAVHFDADNKIVAVSQSLASFIGLDPTMVVPGTPVEAIAVQIVEQEVFDDDSPVRDSLDILAGMAPGEVRQVTLGFRDGRKIDQTFRKLEDGGWIAVYTDNSVVMEAEAQAREAENRWNFALESARQGVWDSDLTNGTVFYSHMWRVLRGLEDADDREISIDAWRGRIHPEDRDRVLDYMMRQDQGETFAQGIEYRERHQDGRWIWILSRGHAVAWDQNGKPSRIIGTDTDITETRNTQAALSQAEARWNFALQGTGQGVWDADLLAKTVFYSPTWREMRGFDLEEEIDSSVEAWLERIHPDDRDRIRDTIKRQDNGAIDRNFFEYRERHRDGHYFWIQSRGEPVAWDSHGRPTRMIGVDIDITARKELEIKVRESLQLLNTTLDSFPGGICLHDKDLVLTVANKGYYEINGLDEAWFPVGSTLEDILRHITERGDYGEVDADSFVEERLEEYRSPVPNKREFALPDGRTIESKYTPLDTGGFLMTFEDITARKALETKVAESLQLLNTTLDNFPGGILLFDKDLILTVVNRAYYDIARIDPERFPVGCALEDIYRHHAARGEYGPGDVETLVADLMADARTFTPHKYTRIRLDDGATLEIDRIPLENGGYVMTLHDITERLQADSEKLQLEKELIQAQRLESLGTLASGIAHEINTPIQYVGDNIRFIAQSLRDMLDILQHYRKSMRQPIDPGLISEHANQIAELEHSLDLGFILEELPQALEQSAQGVKQVATIVKAIKEFSHPGQDEKTEFDINALIETTLVVSRNQWKYVAEVETSLDPDLPAFKCLPGELGQAFLNLVVNAAHAIESVERESGLIRVATRREGNNAIIEITDNGCGIPDHIRERIYDPFFTTKDIGKGTGQGLAITFNAVVKKHNGTIECASEDGEGTTFTVSLPIEADESQKDAA